MALMDSFYNCLTDGWGLDRLTVLEGFSRGGLYAFNWAARHPCPALAWHTLMLHQTRHIPVMNVLTMPAPGVCNLTLEVPVRRCLTSHRRQCTHRSSIIPLRMDSSIMIKWPLRRRIYNSIKIIIRTLNMPNSSNNNR